MKRLASKRPSPALVLSIVAVLIALGGQAGALPGKDKVRKGDIAKGAVTAKALARGAVGSKALASKAVKAADLAPGSVHGRALGPMIVREFPIADPDPAADLIWSASAIERTSCAAGERALSGGMQLSAGNHRQHILGLVPGTDIWSGEFASDSGGSAIPGRLFLLCLR